jgi:nucleoid-associated protein YgaU
MGLFGKSFEEKVHEALAELEGMNIGVSTLSADINDKVVTLHGTARDMAAKTRAMNEFNAMVETENTLNLIRLAEAESAPTAETQPVEVATEAPPIAEAAEERIYEVVAGDTLGGIAKMYYGNAGLYTRIFEANRDILDDPNLIKVGQKLRIP